MTPAEKSRLHEEAQAHVDAVRGRVAELLTSAKAELDRILKNPNAYFPTFAAVRALFSLKRRRVEDLGRAETSPYFARCDVRTRGEGGQGETWRFGRQAVVEEGIFSWVAPAAALRFADPGPASYAMPDGSTRAVTLERADQYLVVDGRVRFMSTASAGAPRTLVYQEQFGRRKTGFVLPEIVETMERAQDVAVRAHWRGPFAVVGPAGSGKTTVALHRVAYLCQSPETAPKFPAEECVAFVADASSREYFAALMPELGIGAARVTTFAEWGMRLLRLDPATFVTRFGASEPERDAYELAKSAALRRAWSDDLRACATGASGDTWSALDAAWRAYGLDGAVWARQWAAGALDRFDVALLLHAMRHREGRLVEEVEYYDRVRGSLVKKKAVTGVRFALAVLDEIQNWLPEEVALVQGCADPATQALVYVGDPAQRTRVGAVRSWQDVAELPDGRVARMGKVWRNPRPVLEWLRGLGYPVEIPASAKEGVPVQVTRGLDEEGVASLVEAEAGALSDGQTLGVVCRSPEACVAFHESPRLRELLASGRVLVRTALESQGVEFDATVVVGGPAEWLGAGTDDEMARIRRDVLYVAATRTLGKLVVVEG